MHEGFGLGGAVSQNIPIRSLLDRTVLGNAPALRSGFRKEDISDVSIEYKGIEYTCIPKSEIPLKVAFGGDISDLII